VRLHVVDFRLEFDLPRFHPLKRLDIPSNFSSVVILNNATVVPKMDNKRNQATPSHCRQQSCNWCANFFDRSDVQILSNNAESQQMSWVLLTRSGRSASAPGRPSFSLRIGSKAERLKRAEAWVKETEGAGHAPKTPE